MARLQGRIVINPKVLTDNRDALAIAYNEAYRMVMEANNFEPMAEPTEEQKQFFADTAYANDPLQLKRTITARIATYDDSVPNPTPEQYQDVVNMLEMVQQAGVIQNQEEEDVVSSTLEDMAEKAGQMEQLNPMGEEAMPQDATPVEPGAMEPGAMPVEPGAMPDEQGAVPMEQGAEGPMPPGVDPAMLQQLTGGGEGASGVNEQLMAQAADKGGGVTDDEYYNRLRDTMSPLPPKKLTKEELTDQIRQRAEIIKSLQMRPTIGEAIPEKSETQFDKDTRAVEELENRLAASQANADRRKEQADGLIKTLDQVADNLNKAGSTSVNAGSAGRALGRMNAQSVGARSYTDASGKRVTEYQPVEGLDVARAIRQSNNSASGRILRMADMAQKNGGVDYIVGRLNDEKTGAGVRKNIEKQLAAFDSLRGSYEAGGLIQYDESGNVVNAPEGWRERIAAANMLRQAINEASSGSSPKGGTLEETKGETPEVAKGETPEVAKGETPEETNGEPVDDLIAGEKGNNVYEQVASALNNSKITEKEAKEKVESLITEEADRYIESLGGPSEAAAVYIQSRQGSQSPERLSYDKSVINYLENVKDTKKISPDIYYRIIAAIDERLQDIIKNDTGLSARMVRADTIREEERRRYNKRRAQEIEEQGEARPSPNNVIVRPI